jgi:hypothetical protein
MVGKEDGFDNIGNIGMMSDFSSLDLKISVGAKIMDY